MAPTPATHDDGELARRVAAAGDREAEAELCRRLAPRLLAYGRRHLGDAAAAEDLAQDVLMATIESLRAGRVEHPERIHGYVLSTCRLLAARRRRDEGRRRELLAAAAPWLVMAGDERAPSPPDLDRLAGCLERLEPRARSAVVATFFAAESPQSIADALGTSPGNVRVLRHRALRALHGCMTEAP